nr:platelet endothelial cell adhesion molecule isoform X2 [Zootoca vivipara]
MYCVLLLIFLHCCTLKAQSNVFTINSVTLRAAPSVEVNNGESVTLNCSADISKSKQFQMNYTFSFFKYGLLLVNSSSEKEWADYTIPMARFSDSGQYSCALDVEGKKRDSSIVAVQVHGITKPILTAEKTEVMEGETVSLSCKAPEEKAPFYFKFYKNDQHDPEQQWERHAFTENFAELKYQINAGDTILFFECEVHKTLGDRSEKSERSDKRIVTVIEPFSVPTLTIHPPQNITEGDNLRVDCTTIARHQDRIKIEMIIQKNKTILNSTKSGRSVQYSKVATMEDNGNYMCKVELGSVSKISTVNVVVAELFSKPILVHNQTRWDENSMLQIECQVNSSLPIHFSVIKDNRVVASRDVYTVTKVRVSDSGVYVCRAEINGIAKESAPARLHVYAPVSKPRLSPPTSQVAILGKFFTVKCYSSNGTLPITYTLYRGGIYVNKTEVKVNESAKFSVKATNAHVPEDYSCEAKNGHSVPQRSTRVNITVIAPVGNINLGRLSQGDVEDGKELAISCSVGSGSYPIEFTFFRENHPKPVYKVTEKTKRTAVWYRDSLTSQDGGKYFCRADNQAKSPVESNIMIVKVVLASWKKWLIVVIIMLILFGVAIAASWWYVRKRAKAKGNPLELTSSITATNSVGEKLTPRQNNEGEFYFGSGYNEDGEKNNLKSNEDGQGPDLENSEVEYTDVQVSAADSYRAPVVQKTETVYTEIRKATNDAGGNRHSRIESSPDET